MSNLSNLVFGVSTALEKFIAQTKYINFESLNVRVAEGTSLSLNQGGDLSPSPQTIYTSFCRPQQDQKNSSKYFPFFACPSSLSEDMEGGGHNSHL